MPNAPILKAPSFILKIVLPSLASVLLFTKAWGAPPLPGSTSAGDATQLTPDPVTAPPSATNGGSSDPAHPRPGPLTTKFSEASLVKEASKPLKAKAAKARKAAAKTAPVPPAQAAVTPATPKPEEKTTSTPDTTATEPSSFQKSTPRATSGTSNVPDEDGAPGATTLLTWRDCVNQASDNNAEIRAARENLKALQATEGVQFGGFLPTVTGMMDVTRNSDTSPNNNRYSMGLSLSQNLFAGGADLAKVRRARANSRESEAKLRIANAKVSADLKNAYESVVFAKGNLALNRDIVRRREDNLRLVQLRFESGRENKGSVLLSKANLAQARYDELQSANSVPSAASQLAISLGLDSENASFQLKEATPAVDPVSGQPNFDTLATQAPEYAQVIAVEQSTEQGVQVAKGSLYFPTLSLTGSRSRAGSEFLPGDQDQWGVGLTLSFPLFNGGRDYYTTQSASASYREASGTRMNLTRSLRTKLRLAYYAFVEAVEKENVNMSYRDAALSRAEIARAKYNNGLMTFEDWDLIENDLINRQRAFLQSHRDRVSAEAAWEQAQGKGVLQ